MLRPTRERLAWLAMTVLLGLEIRFDFLRLLDPTYKAAFQGDSDWLVRSEMLNPASVPFPVLGGQGNDYTSQFGLQGMVMTWLSPGDHFYEAMRLTTALFTGAVFATAVVACWRAWGGRAAAVLLAFLATSFWTNGFGASTYWQLWTMLLPTLVPLLVWPRLGEGRRKWLRGAALIAALVFLKSLCGYEYITTVLLGAAAGVAFHEFRGRIDRGLLLRLTGVVGAGIAGFGAAIVVHIAQLMSLYGNAGIIRDRMAERTFSPSDVSAVLQVVRGWHDPLWGWLVHGDSLIGLWVFQMIHYLLDPAVALPSRTFTGFTGSYSVPIWLFIVLGAWIAVRAFRGKGADAWVQRRLAVAAGLGLVGAFSWLVLAYGHMINHAHIDAIVFYLPFLPLVFAMIALRLQTFSLRVWPLRPRASRAQDRPRTGGPADAERELAEAAGGIR